MEVALQWCSDGFSDTLVGFANSIRTIDGGTHIEGLRAALTRVVNGIGGYGSLPACGANANRILKAAGAVVLTCDPRPHHSA